MAEICCDHEPLFVSFVLSVLTCQNHKTFLLIFFTFKNYLLLGTGFATSISNSRMEVDIEIFECIKGFHPTRSPHYINYSLCGPLGSRRHDGHHHEK